MNSSSARCQRVVFLFGLFCGLIPVGLILVGLSASPVLAADLSASELGDSARSAGVIEVSMSVFFSVLIVSTALLRRHLERRLLAAHVAVEKLRSELRLEAERPRYPVLVKGFDLTADNDMVVVRRPDRRQFRQVVESPW